jgi:ABC-type Fe3+-siderophore transport system permease subunit
VLTAGAGAWPGSYYAFPLAIVVLCGLLAAGVVLTRVVRRPLQSEDVAVDEALRCSAAGAVTAAVGLLIAVPLAGVSVVAGAALVGISCHPEWWTIAAIALAGLAVASLALAAWCASTLTTRDWRDARPVVPADR